jgi:hypothetical protein
MLSSQAAMIKAAAWARDSQSGSAGKIRVDAGSLSLTSSTVICPTPTWI